MQDYRSYNNMAVALMERAGPGDLNKSYDYWMKIVSNCDEAQVRNAGLCLQAGMLCSWYLTRGLLVDPCWCVQVVAISLRNLTDTPHFNNALNTVKRKSVSTLVVLLLPSSVDVMNGSHGIHVPRSGVSSGVFWWLDRPHRRTSAYEP